MACEEKTPATYIKYTATAFFTFIHHIRIKQSKTKVGLWSKKRKTKQKRIFSQVPVVETQGAAGRRGFTWLGCRGNPCKVIKIILLMASLGWSKDFLYREE